MIGIIVSNDPVNRWDLNGQFGLIGALVGGTIGAVAGGVVGYISSGGDWNAAAAGTAGGAVSGVIMGSGVGLIAAGVAAGTTSGTAAVATAMTVNAAAEVMGNTVQQITENKLNGQSTGQAIANVNPTEQVISGAVGAATGGLSGGAVVLKQAVNESIQQAQAKVANYTTSKIAPALREMLPAGGEVNDLVTKVVQEGAQSTAKQVGSMTATVVGVTAVDEGVVPFVEEATSNAIAAAAENEEPSPSPSP